MLNRIFKAALSICAFSGILLCQTRLEPLHVSVCDLVDHPEKYNGKFVSVRGRYQLGKLRYISQDIPQMAAACGPLPVALKSSSKLPGTSANVTLEGKVHLEYRNANFQGAAFGKYHWGKSWLDVEEESDIRNAVFLNGPIRMPMPRDP